VAVGTTITTAPVTESTHLTARDITAQIEQAADDHRLVTPVTFPATWWEYLQARHGDRAGRVVAWLNTVDDATRLRVTPLMVDMTLQGRRAEYNNVFL
jgi:hypothetical protein